MSNSDLISMKRMVLRGVLTIFMVTTFSALTRARPATNDFSLVVTIVTGERGKDSNSTTTTLTITEDRLVYQQRYHGAHSGDHPPVKKEYKLNTAERDDLIKALQDKGLLVTKTLAALSPERGPGFYFSLVIHSKLNGKEHSVTINLPRRAENVKADRLYQDSVSLVQQLYRLINQTDTTLSMPELIQ